MPVFPWGPQGGPLMAPSGVSMIGSPWCCATWCSAGWAAWWPLLPIVAGAALSGAVAPPQLVLASTTAFFLSELADFAVYTPLQ